MSCICKECRIEYKVDINLPNELWNKIKPKNGNLLCGPCIMKKLEELNCYDYWDLVKKDKLCQE